MKHRHHTKCIHTSTTYIRPLILIFCSSKSIILFHGIIIYVFSNLDTILYPSGKLEIQTILW